MEIVTGYKGQPHITAENCADLNRGIVGSDSYVLSVGRMFEAELVSNNLLKIRDGTALIQGRQFVIPSGQSDEITIENGTQGENRTDLVVARYTKNNDTKVEEVTPVYIKGTPSASDPALPEYNEDGDIRAGDLTADMPLYALDLEGINVVAVRPLFNILESAAQLNSKILKVAKHIQTYTVQANKVRRIELSKADFGISNNVDIQSGYVEVRSANPSLCQGTFNPDALVLYVANNHSSTQNIDCIVYLFYTE